jgi:hypothetical protein
MSEPALTLLEYASAPLSRERWGPVVFRFSRVSLLLLALTALGAVWLGLRHEPWRQVGVIGDQGGGLAFTRDNRILAFGPSHGANLYDPATATVVRNVLPSVDLNTYRYFALAGGARILALPYTQRMALLYDTGSGRVVERLANPDGLGSRLVAIAPDGPRLVTHWVGGKRPGSSEHYLGWSLTGGDGDRAPAQLQNEMRFGDMEFSTDGKRLIQFGRSGYSGAPQGFELFDGVTFNLIKRRVAPGGGSMLAVGFADAERLWAVRVEPANNGGNPRVVLETWSSATGEMIGEVAIGLNGVPIQYLWDGVVVSDDLRWVAVPHPGPVGEPILDLFDARTGLRVRRQAYRYTQPIKFFPHSDRLLVTTLKENDLAVIDVHHAQPLAILRGQGRGMFAPDPRISSDGQTILTPADPIGERITVDRQTGWDCPPSPLGALAFWATWLTTGAFAALMASVWRDARRARREQGRYRVHAVISVGLTVVGSVMTLHLLLTACLGGWIWTPAPLLLVCGVGLATRSRFWRLSTLVLLASLVPLEANLGHQLQRRGLDFSSTWTLLDRAYDVPNMAPYVAIAVAAGLTIVALPLLARRAVEAG